MRMLQPIHPARRAVGASGFRSSMISRTKKCFGTRTRSDTSSRCRSYRIKTKLGLFAGGQPFAHGAKGAVDDLSPKAALLSLEFEFLRASRTVKIGDRPIALIAAEILCSAVWTEQPSFHPLLGPDAGRSAIRSRTRRRIPQSQVPSAKLSRRPTPEASTKASSALASGPLRRQVGSSFQRPRASRHAHRHPPADPPCRLHGAGLPDRRGRSRFRAGARGDAGEGQADGAAQSGGRRAAGAGRRAAEAALRGRGRPRAGGRRL